MEKAPSGLGHLAEVNISGLFRVLPAYAPECEFCCQLDTPWNRKAALRNYLQQTGLWRWMENTALVARRRARLLRAE